MKTSRSFSKLAAKLTAYGLGAGLLATLGGCVVAPIGPPPRAVAVYPAPVYVQPAPAVVVQPRGYYRYGPRYRY